MEFDRAKDADLLARFVDERDSEAFEALLRRHGPMVLGTCTRILRHHEDAEDAFQATFLVLAMRAGRIRKREAVAGWLFEVARRTAIRARSVRRREQMERHLLEMTQMKSADGSSSSELSSLLDAEIARLAPKYRDPVVLCYLEGRTNVEAAKELGLPLGTVATRLRRAKETLRNRLMAQGFGASPQALDGALTASQSLEIVPAALLASTAKAVSIMSCQKPTATVSSPRPLRPRALPLANAVVKSMLTAKLALTAVLLLSVSISVGAVTQAVRTWAAAPNLISIDVVDPRRVPVPGASVWVVVDGHEEVTTCDDQGHCTIHRPSLKSGPLIIFCTSPGYRPALAVRSRLPRFTPVIIPLTRGGFPGRILVKYAGRVHTIEPTLPVRGDSIKTYEVNLDGKGRLMKPSPGNEHLRVDAQPPPLSEE